MSRAITVYYTFCPRKQEALGAYLQYQRKIADEILNYGFKKLFKIEFNRDKVRTGKHGKPYWDGGENVWFNVSNTDGLVVCAVAGSRGKVSKVEIAAEGSGGAPGGLGNEIGVDTEQPRSVRMSLLHRCCSLKEMRYILGEEYSPGGKEFCFGESGADGFGADICSGTERKARSRKETREEIRNIQVQDRFAQIWTLKESYIKMTGEGMSFPLKEAAFSIEEKVNGEFNISCIQPGFFAQRKIEGYWIAVCNNFKEESKIDWQELKFPRIYGKFRHSLRQ